MGFGRKVAAEREMGHHSYFRVAGDLPEASAIITVKTYIHSFMYYKGLGIINCWLLTVYNLKPPRIPQSEQKSYRNHPNLQVMAKKTFPHLTALNRYQGQVICMYIKKISPVTFIQDLCAIGINDLFFFLLKEGQTIFQTLDQFSL